VPAVDPTSADNDQGASEERTRATIKPAGITQEDCAWAVNNLAVEEKDLSPPNIAALGLLQQAKKEQSILRMLLDRTLPPPRSMDEEGRDEMLDLTGLDDQILAEFGELTHVVKHLSAHPEKLPAVMEICS